MKTRLFLVIISRGQWWVDCEGKSFGPFESSDVAISGAVHYAEVFDDCPSIPNLGARRHGPHVPSLVEQAPEGWLSSPRRGF